MAQVAVEKTREELASGYVETDIEILCASLQMGVFGEQISDATLTQRTQISLLNKAYKSLVADMVKADSWKGFQAVQGKVVANQAKLETAKAQRKEARKKVKHISDDRNLLRKMITKWQNDKVAIAAQMGYTIEARFPSAQILNRTVFKSA